jgi:hypothetical protein
MDYSGDGGVSPAGVHLLGRLAGSGLPFLFKGGTSLLLHSPVFRHISTDIDIVPPVANLGVDKTEL